MTGLDLSFYNWEVISKFVLNGLYFSVILTVVATIGGIVFGTILALMRLSGKKWLDAPAAIYVNGMRSIPLVMVILGFFLLVLLTQTIILFQDTSLVYAIGAYDLLKGLETAGKNYGRPIEAYLLAAVVYFVMCYTLSYFVKRLHKKIAIIR